MALSFVLFGQLAAWPADVSAAMNYFQPAVNYSVGYNPMAVYTNDFNNDGELDLATADYSGPEGVTIRLGSGDGTFQEKAEYAAGWYVSSVDGDDFNGDGAIDLVVANQHADTVSVLLGNGDGTFGPPASYPTGETPVAAAVGDFNDDNFPDIATANYDGSSVSILLGNDDGTFAAKADYHAANGPLSIQVYDVNQDSRTDVVFASANLSTGVAVLYGNGDGTLGTSTHLVNANFPRSARAADFNGDSIPDLAVANTTSSGGVTIALANGDGTFGAVKQYLTSPYAASMNVADVNGDGRLDLLVGSETDSTVSFLIGNGDGTFRPRSEIPAGGGPSGFAFGDFNGDGRTDAATVNYLDHSLSVLLNGNSDAYDIAADMSALAIGFADGDTASGVTLNLTLPSEGANGSTITWQSDRPAVITDSGVVTRPSYSDGDVNVTMYAVIAKGSHSDQMQFTVTVTKNALSNEESVDLDSTALAIGYAEGDSTIQVTQDVILPTSGGNGTTISWTSDNPDVISEDGSVSQPTFTDGDAVVTLTATITKGSVNVQSTFELTVVKAPMQDVEAVGLDREALVIGYTSGDSDIHVTKHLILPTSGVNGTSISWASSQSSVIGTDGSVSRPAYADGDVNVTLTATINRGDSSLQKTFAVTVIRRAEETVYKGVDIPLEDRDGGVSDEVEIGFSFSFFGQEYESVFINANGNLTFDNPASGADYIVAPFGDDLDNVRILYKTIGQSPNRQFIVQWTDVDTFDNGFLGTFQAILYESSNEIRFQYRDLDSHNPQSDGSNALIGLMSGFTMVAYSQFSSSLMENLAVLFTPDGGSYTFDDGIDYEPIYLSNTISSNANLSAVTLNGITLNFNENVETYTVNVAHGVSSTVGAYTMAEPSSEVRILLNGTPIDAGDTLPLSVGANEIQFVVTAQDRETVKTYTVNVIRASAPPITNPDTTPTVPSQPEAPNESSEPSEIPSSGTFEVNSSERSEWVLEDAVRIVVPAGAVPDGGQMTVTIVPADEAPGSESMKSLSEIFEFKSTTGRAFNTPLEITFHYDASQVSEGNRPVVYYYNELFKRWLYVGGIVNPDGTVTIRINHFTKFAVYEYEAVSFSDMEKHWSAPYTERLMGMGVLSGFPDHTFRPEERITRAQAAVMLTKALMLTKPAGDKAAVFIDEASLPTWAKDSAAAVHAASLMQGYLQDGGLAFGADQYVTRAEMAVIVANVLQAYGFMTDNEAVHFTDSDLIPAWAKASVDAAAAANIFGGFEDGTFRPSGAVTRAEATAILFRLLETLYI